MLMLYVKSLNKSAKILSIKNRGPFSKTKMSGMPCRAKTESKEGIMVNANVLLQC